MEVEATRLLHLMQTRREHSGDLRDNPYPVLGVLSQICVSTAIRLSRIITLIIYTTAHTPFPAQDLQGTLYLHSVCGKM